MKHVLYDGTNAIDSIEYDFNYSFCRSIGINLFEDENNDCTYDQGIDNLIGLPVTVTVDSNGYTIDTLSFTNGVYYNALGNPWDVYTYNVIDAPMGFQACSSFTDTLYSAVYTGMHGLGLVCSGNSFDLNITTFAQTAANGAQVNMVIGSNACVAPNAQVTMTFGPDYIFDHAWPMTTSQTGNTLIWDLQSNSFLYNSQYISVSLLPNGQILTPGDTVQMTFEVTPITGDTHPSDNIVVRHDTVTGPYDPNAVYVSPTGCVEPGTRLQYTVTFENMGNDTAHNIYVMDTLSSGFEMQSVKILAASHLMNVTKVSNGGYNILKFEFPNIDLPDSSSPARHGMVMYTIDMVDNFSIGSAVTNKAGIFFDYMPAVLTNVASTTACWPASVNEVSTSANSISIYPNPATEN